MTCPCCVPQSGCGCTCPAPSYSVGASYPTVPANPPNPTPCLPDAPSAGDGWGGTFIDTVYSQTLLNPCWSPFPPYDASQDWCGLPANNWKMPGEDGCDTEWVADTAAPYFEANCLVKVWLGASTRGWYAERSSGGSCECLSTSTGLEYVYRFFIINCNTGLWEDKTSQLVKRNKYRLCSGGSVYAYNGADCSAIDPSVLYYPAPVPPTTLEGCNPLP